MFSGARTVIGPRNGLAARLSARQRCCTCIWKARVVVPELNERAVVRSHRVRSPIRFRIRIDVAYDWRVGADVPVLSIARRKILRANDEREEGPIDS